LECRKKKRRKSHIDSIGVFRAPLNCALIGKREFG